MRCESMCNLYEHWLYWEAIEAIRMHCVGIYVVSGLFRYTDSSEDFFIDVHRFGFLRLAMVHLAHL